MPTVTQEAAWSTVATYSSTDAFYPNSQWKPTRKLSQARCDWEMAVEVGAIDMVPALQFANDVTDPSNFATKAIGTRKTLTGVHNPAAYTAVGTTSDSKRYFRTGWLAKSVTDQNHASARAGGTWDLYFE